MKNDNTTRNDQTTLTEASKAKRFLSWFLLGADPVTLLAESIEKLTETARVKEAARKAALEAEAACDEAPGTEESAKEEAVPAFAVQELTDGEAEEPTTAMDKIEDVDEDTEDAEKEVAEEAEEDVEEETEGDEKELSFHGFGSKGLHFIDVMEEPELYRELKKREKRGEIALVTRYRRTFESRLALSDDEIRKYYSTLKNKLLSYRGVKARISRNVETYNKGRVNLVKLDVKSKSLYLYLGMDPSKVALLEGGKYKVRDLSQKKKYASVPTLFKIRGPRKMKYALELLDLLCNEELALEKNKKFKEQDYAKGKYTEEQLIKKGVLRKLVAEIPCEK